MHLFLKDNILKCICLSRIILVEHCFMKVRLFCSKFKVEDGLQSKINDLGEASLNRTQCSEMLFSEQMISECEKSIAGDQVSHLTFMQYQNMDTEAKSRIHNRVRQWSLKARESLPKDDHGLFCLVVGHLLKNAHRYFKLDGVSDFQHHILEEKSISDITRQKIMDDFKNANQKIREIGHLKCKNRLAEQQECVSQLKKSFHSLRNISFMSGVSLKTIHNWCSLPKGKIHKSTALSKMRKQEFENFLLQDSMSFAHPSKKFAGKRFLRDTLEVTRRRYLQQPEFHTNGIISLSSMKAYRPKYIMLCRDTPLDQCLCDKCDNCEQLLKTLIGLGVKSVPPNRYVAVDTVICDHREKQAGSEFSFPKLECILGACDLCGESILDELIRSSNENTLSTNRNITWHKWLTPPGKSVPVKCTVKGTFRHALDELLDTLRSLKAHLFCANWNRNIFENVRKTLQIGHVVQIIDFAMNYRNMYQDEIQSAYWDGTQTCIHAVINYFQCQHCTDVVTLVLAQITNNLKHDSFVAHAAHEASFRYLAQIGIDMQLILQFCDNCSSQYKSRRPFAEMARSALNIIRVFFGEKHGKSQCDGFFGRLKAWMTYKIKTRKVIVTNAYDFFRFCKEEYEMSPKPGECQHYRVIFQYLRPSDIRHHQDCDLDQAIPGTRSIFSIRNTPHPLKLKVRNRPCLCPPCLYEDGQECHNSKFCDPWREVDLIPIKGQNKKKHMKRKHPKDCVAVEESAHITAKNAEPDSDEENLPDIVIESAEGILDEEDKLMNLTANCNANNGDFCIDLTEGTTNVETEPAVVDDVIITGETEEITDCDKEITDYLSMELATSEDEIADKVYWENILGCLERCSTDIELRDFAADVHINLKPLCPRKKNIHFRPDTDYIDTVATESIPEDAPSNVHAIKILPDGNCLGRSISHGYIGNDSMHLEMRARMVIEGILNKQYYLSHDFLTRGASRIEEPLPFVYAKYSDHYVSGQKMTDDTVEYMYSRELHDCCKVNSYMGLWQMAQAASVLQIPIRLVYPTGGDPEMRLDFNRWFYPLNYEENTCEGKAKDFITIMWTAMRKNSVPVHFVPLLPRRTKYDNLLRLCFTEFVNFSC